MTLQVSSFSPEATLEKLTGEKKDQGSDDVTPKSLSRTQPVKSNLHALIIGINKYLCHIQLQGAVNDASLFKSYLLNDLLVPEAQITTLFDEQATRAEIIRAFQNLATDAQINYNDPIVIYYAGHGAEIQPPPSRYDAHGPYVQSLVPQDAGTKDPSTPGVPPIPDFTINSLLNKIAKSKGDNICVIFDSCHSASITRTGRGKGSRAVHWLSFSPLPEEIDSELFIEDSSTPVLTRTIEKSQGEMAVQGMHSHVLLAACSSKGLAYEDLDDIPHHGYFTKALLKVLRTVGPTRLTYKSCIQRLPRIEASCPQDPVCEGTNVDRMFFNAMVAGGDNSFILLEEKDTKVYLRAGSAHGITPGCLFAIHADPILDHANPSVGNMVVDQVTPFRSLLKPADKAPNFVIPNPGYARQIGTGSEHALDVYISPEFEQVVPTDPRWKIAFSGGENSVVLRLVERDLAALVIDVNAQRDATFMFPRLESAVRNGVSVLQYTAPVHFRSVYRVIVASARFIWHLERLPHPRPFQKSVRMEFYKLKESGTNEETGSPILDIDGSSLNFGGFASIEINGRDRYAFRILNSSSRDLYAYLFYFSLTTLEIRPRFIQVVGSGHIDPSLPKGGFLTLGYGSGGVGPFQFNLKPGESTDVGVFKLFLSTSPIDMSSIEQDPPFGIEPRRLVTENEAKHKFSALRVGMWDAITMELRLSRPIEVQNSEDEFESHNTTFPLLENEEIEPEDGSWLAELLPEKPYALLRDVKLIYGLVIDPDSGPRWAKQPVSRLTGPSAQRSFNARHTVTIEEVKSSNVLDAALAQLGFPSLGDMPNMAPLDGLSLNGGLQKWTTRRIIVGHLTFALSATDFMPNSGFVSDVRCALDQTKDREKLAALKKVFETCRGRIIPLCAVAGFSSAETAMDNEPNWPRPPSNADLESDKSDNWGIVKVTRVGSILEVLDKTLQERVKKLYARLFFRSPCVGTRSRFGFDGSMYQSQCIEEIEIGFSDMGIERIVIRYSSGSIAGPYGISGESAQISRFSITKADETITDIFVWATDNQISSIQFLTSNGRGSPIYGALWGASQGPTHLSGNGCALVGLSGGFDAHGITQLQAIWRGDTHTKGYQRMEICHIGGNHGRIWSDWGLSEDMSQFHISSISAREPGTGLLGGFQITYTSSISGAWVSWRTPTYGTDIGPTVKWDLNGGRITRVRGRHNGATICELHDTCVNSMALVWLEPRETQLILSGITVMSPQILSRNPNPQATLYNLCTKTCNSNNVTLSFEDYSKTRLVTRSNSVKPPLHALIIGINNYKSNFRLVAAVQDALHFKQYLTKELNVPEEQIQTLLDDKAKRADIIKALQELGNEDNGIRPGDAIVIYYAGYGSEVEPPPDHTLNDSLVQCIVPQDASVADGVLPIPEFTIGALAHKIAQEKGNNIVSGALQLVLRSFVDCVLFLANSCFCSVLSYFSGGSYGDPVRGVRFIDKKLLSPLPAFCDHAIIQGSLSTSDVVDPFSLGWFLQGMDTNAMNSYVFIAACGPQEVAFEDTQTEQGYFSMALLNMLKNFGVNSLTYKDLIQRFPALRTSQPQNPVCEGQHIDRILFNGLVEGIRTDFIAIEQEQSGFYLQAGLIKGITPGSKYAIHVGDVFGPLEATDRIIEVDRVDPFTAHVKDGSGLPTLCYGRQVVCGPERALDIYVSETFVKAVEPSTAWSRAFSADTGDLGLRPVSPELAQVILSIGKPNETTFNLTNPISVKYCINTLPPFGKPDIPPTAPHVIPIISALAKWNWYLRLMPTPRPFQSFIDLEFYKLRVVEESIDQSAHIFGPEGGNLAVGGVVDITANAEDRYGIRVINRSSLDLYLYLFAFSLTNLSIVRKIICPTSSSSQGLLLAQSNSVTVGYGSDGQLPFTFSLEEDQQTDATTLKLFVATHPAEFESIEQEGPFDSSGVSSDNKVKDLFGTGTTWDAVDMHIVYRSAQKKNNTILVPLPGLTITSPLKPTVNLVPNLKPFPSLVPQFDITPPTSGDRTSVPYTGGLFTGRSSGPLQVQTRGLSIVSARWFCTPALSQELLSSIRCMRLRTLGQEIRLSKATPSTQSGGYFEVSVVGPDGLRRQSTDMKETAYRSHPTPSSSEWVDGIVFEEDHEVWKDIRVGDYFEVSICIQEQGLIYDAKMGNLVFW
ncbi:Caspase domain, partial [Rhizoctonia solani]